jgi:hypothetical protein
MQLKRTKRILLVLCCCIIAVFIASTGYWLRFSPPSIPPKVSFVGFTNAGTGLVAQFAISNASTRPVDYNLCPMEMKTNGYWAHSQSPTGPASRLLPRQSTNFFVSPPEIAGTWRVPIEWYQLPTRGDVLRYRIKRRFELFRQWNGFAPDAGMYVQGYAVFTPEQIVEEPKEARNK